MLRIEPGYYLKNQPCSIVSITCADPKNFNVNDVKIDKYGYCTLQDMNKAVRKCFNVVGYKYFKKGERPILKQLFNIDYAIVCVKGHYIYMEGGSYYSFFENEYDEVICYWRFKK